MQIWFVFLMEKSTPNDLLLYFDALQLSLMIILITSIADIIIKDFSYIRNNEGLRHHKKEEKNPYRDIQSV